MTLCCEQGVEACAQTFLAQREGVCLCGFSEGIGSGQAQRNGLQALALGTNAGCDACGKGFREVLKPFGCRHHLGDEELGCCRRGLDAGVGHGIEHGRVAFMPYAGDDGQGELGAV